MLASSRTNSSTGDIITRFTNCVLVQKNGLVESDLFVNSTTGRIVSPQDSFYKNNARPTRTVDLGGRILSPGFIDVQLNGACGFDFSVIPGDGSESAMIEYEEGLKMANKGIVRTGVTSYLPTLITQRKEVYARVCICLKGYHEGIPQLTKFTGDSTLSCSSIITTTRLCRSRVTWCSLRGSFLESRAKWHSLKTNPSKALC